MNIVNKGNSGPWNNKEVWQQGIVPGPNDDVSITVKPCTIDLVGRGDARSVTIGDLDRLTMTNASLFTQQIFLEAGSTLQAKAGSNRTSKVFSRGGSVDVASGASLNLTGYHTNKSGGTLAIADNATLELTSGEIQNTGVIQLSSTGHLSKLTFAGSLTTDLRVWSSDYKYSGGQLSLSDSAQNLVTTPSATGSITNVNNTITGAGTIAAHVIANEAKVGDGRHTDDHSAGLIRAAGTHNQLILDITSGGVLRNGGVIEATGKAGLLIRDAGHTGATVRVENSGAIAGYDSKVVLDHAQVTNTGRFEAHGGTTIELRDTRITGGTFSSDAAGTVLATGSSSVTGTDFNIGSLSVANGATLKVSGGTFGIGGALTAAGTLSFDTALTFKGGAAASIAGTLSGTGTTLTNINDVISGSGTIRVGGLSNQAAGRIEGGLKLDIAGDLSNAGTISNATVKAAKVTNSGAISGVSFQVTTSPGVAGVINQKTGVINASSFGQTTVANLGLMQADGVGPLVFDGTTVVGGTISSSNGGSIDIQDRKDAVTILDVAKIGAGTEFVIGNGAYLRLDNTNGPPMALDNVSISLAGIRETTQLDFTSSSFVLQGKGEIILSDSASNLLNLDTTFTNVDGTISGAGEIKVATLLDNEAGGIIEANGENDLIIEVDRRFENDGVLEADGATLKIITAGTIAGGGEVLVTNDGTVDLSDARQYLGNLHYYGRGTILGADLVPAGTISGFATGDTYIFGKPTTIGGPLSAVWQQNDDPNNPGGTLTIKGARGQTYATLQLAGRYTSADFAASTVPMPDGNHVAVDFVGALKWEKPVTGNWQTATHWGPTGLFVPGATDDALINAAAAAGHHYFVINEQDTTVKSVATGDGAVLLIRGGTFTTTKGTASAPNTGTVRVEPSATFVTGGTFAQASTGRLVAGGEGATVDIANGGTITGGDIDIAKGAVLKASNGFAALAGVDVINQGTIDVTNQTKLSLTGSSVKGLGSIEVSKGATLALSSSAIHEKIELAGTLEIVGAATVPGAIHLLEGRIASNGSPAIFGNGGALSGTGTIGDDGLTLVNAASGKIDTGAGGEITIATGGNTVVNDGTIRASVGGSVELSSALSNNGKFFAEGGTAEFGDAVTNDGLMQAKGVGSGFDFNGGLVNSGVVRAIDGNARIDVRSAITQEGDGTDPDDGRLLASGLSARIDLYAGSSVTGGLVGITDDAILNASHGGLVTLAHAMVSIDDASNLIVRDTTLSLVDTVVNNLGEAAIIGQSAILALDKATLNGDRAQDSGQYAFFDGAALRVDGDSMVATSASIDLQDGSRIVSNNALATLTNAGFIGGTRGTIGDENLRLSNEGIIVAYGELAIDTGGHPILNDGTMAASLIGSKMSIASEVDNRSTGKLSSGAGTVTILQVSNSGVVAAEAHGHIEIQGTLFNSGQVLANDGGTLAAASTTNSGKATATGAGSTLTLGNGSGAAVANIGQIKADDDGTVVFGNGVTNGPGGQLVAQDGGIVQVTGAATGGTARILGDGSVIDLEGSASADTTMGALFGKEGLGQLLLNNSNHFAGTVAGFAAGDRIDVKDVAFDAARDSFDASTRILTVSDGTHTAKIQLLGQYTAADFAFSSDGHGGTMVTGTATADPAAATMLTMAHA